MTQSRALVHYSKERLGALRNTISMLLAQHFPQEATTSLLESYQDVTSVLEKELDVLSSPGALDGDIAQKSRTVLSKINQITPILGILQRSSSLRLAFELAPPVKRMCRDVLQSDADLKTKPFRIVCASEWDYSPLYYPKLEMQEDMVLLGLPASESDNALLLPIKAHEVGHAFWAYSRRRDSMRSLVETAFRRQVFGNWKVLQGSGYLHGARPASVDDLVTDIFLSNMVTRISSPVIRQAEETFCDFVGLAAFSSSYLSALSYLGAYGADQDYSMWYCSSATRSSLLACAADEGGIPIPLSFSDSFGTESRAGRFPYSNTTVTDAASVVGSPDLLYAIAEMAVTEVAKSLWESACLVVKGAGLDHPNPERVEAAQRYFRALVPAPSRYSLSESLCAAWAESDRLRGFDPDESPSSDSMEWQLRDVEQRALKECVAKTLEIYELETGGDCSCSR